MYYSQYFQDKFVSKIFFNNKKDGYFLDIGAHDGVSLSNTYFFEKEMGWTGVCIEPNPSVFSKLIKNRKSTNLNFAVSSESKAVTFRQIEGMGEMLSGIEKYYDQRHIKRIEKENSKFSGTDRLIEVNSISSRDLVKRFEIRKVDYLSIDTEGNELEILKCFPFELVFPLIISVENNYKDKKIHDFLRKQGYVLFCSLQCDEIYVDKRFLRPSHYFKYWFLNIREKLS